ncbi:MAG TPA: hypothetical protein VLA35_03230 [Thermoleophilia bacterium]|nr:hypothetical protein [Thermoleophilia bacterium]
MRPGLKSGFGVLEVVISAGVLGVIVAATTACVAEALAERARQGVRREAAVAAAAEAERLRALRFTPDPPPAGLDPDGLALGSALGELFPHARPACDCAAAHYVPADAAGEAGSFERLVARPWGTLRVVARFVDFTPAGLEAVQPVVGDDGWAVWSGEAPPSGALLALVTGTLADDSWSTSLSVLVVDEP